MAHILNDIFGLLQLSSISESTGSSVRAFACVSPCSGVVARPFLILPSQVKCHQTPVQAKSMT